ncbi:cytospin-A isoform X4 [Anopheles aquasalis]|uniref:cytospin-A isoform X4 n=1 Tax=Anopheles aquasalis TaxID=42839 RepID=UPI00215B3FC9|nr:cytospin-A isoform X4 [Anopheles aquasalis]
MSTLKQKIRNVFSWQHDDYKLTDPPAEAAPASNENDVANGGNRASRFLKGSSAKPTNVPLKGVGSRTAKINKKRLNQINIARNSSITSAQLNAAVPLVNIRRAPSDRSVLSEIDREIVSKSNQYRTPTRPITVAAIPASSVSGRSSTSTKASSRGSSIAPSSLTSASQSGPIIVRKAPPAPVGNLGAAPDRSLFRSQAKPSRSNNEEQRKSITRKPLLSGFGRQRGQGPSGGTKHSSQTQRSSSPTGGTNGGGGGGGGQGGAGYALGGTGASGALSANGGGTTGAGGGGGLLKSAASVSSLEYTVVSKPQSRGGQQQRFNGSKERLDHHSGHNHNQLQHHHHHHHHHPQQQQQQQQAAHQHSRTASAHMAQHATSGIIGMATASSTNHLNMFPPGGAGGGDGPVNERAVDAGNSLSSSMEQLTAISFTGPERAVQKAPKAHHHHHHQQQQQQPQSSPNRLAELQVHLEKLQTENRQLEEKVHEMSSCQEELLLLRDEIVRLKTSHEQSNGELHRLLNENESLRDRLKTVVQSPLSDSEKQQLIRNTQRLHSSAPASIALPNNMDAEGTPCVTPDWDKQSSSSEVAVACLQDKIIQMEETHYSTNEELQATLQELADLQSQILELQSDNERLVEEKDVIFQSLCRQTEKLEDSRTQIGTLQNLLLREPNPQDVTPTDREQKLVDLLKSAQDEREGLLVKQEELNGELNELKGVVEERTGEVSRIKARVSLLESSLEAANAEQKDINAQLLESKEDASVKMIEISRLTTLLENARAKIDELEQDRAMGDKTDLEELLDVARKEKDQLETQVASLQEQVSISQCEVQKLKDQLARLNEECKVVRNNAKCVISDLEYKNETVTQEKQKMAADYQLLQESINELQVQNKCLLEDKAQLETLLSEMQKHLGETERKLMEKTEELNQETRLRKQEADEWDHFQSDLLMTVRVANDFKTEAQNAREKLALDNKALREKVRVLEQQIEQLNKQLASKESQNSLITSVQQEMAVRRQQKSAIQRQDSRLSVKSLIESIENSAKQTKLSSDSRCSSSSSINSIPADGNPTLSTKHSTHVSDNSINNNNNNNDNNGQAIGSNNVKSHTNGNNNDENDVLQIPVQATATVPASLPAKSPLREQQQPTAGGNVANSNTKPNQSASADTVLLMKKSSLINTSNGCNTTINPAIISHKTMDYVRRNSYNDISERKDPLNALVKNGGSKRNALLKWCQNKAVGYRNIDITNFSSSWNDGLALCAIMHSYLPDRVPYDKLNQNDKRRNFSLAFAAAESVGIPTSLNIDEMCLQERPDWQQVMSYVTAIYKHFET